MTQFKGIFQVTKKYYDSIEDKSGYLFLVRDGKYLSDGTTLDISMPYTESIYFGTRKYADNSESFIAEITKAFGGLLDSEGGFILPAEADGDTFANIDESKASSLLDLFKGLDEAISANSAKFADYYTEIEIDGKIKVLNEAIAKCLTAVSVKVGDEVYEGVNGQIDLTDAFEAAGKVKGVAVDGTPVELDENGIANVVLSGKADNSVVNTLSGRVDALEAFKHADDVVYDSENKVIYLTADGEKLGEGFDASPFIVDGMIDSVEFVKDAEGANTTTLRFVFNTDGGKKTIDVDFSKYVDTYHADETSITLDSETNTFSVKAVDAEKVDVDAIPVGGTPLADILLAKNITAITAGNLQAVLEGLFSQNLWAENPRRNVPTSLSTSMSAPSISLDKSGTQEVGTTVNLSASAKTASASASITYSGFTYGYSLANDNTKDGDTPASVSVSGTKDSDSDYKLTFVTNNGFGGVDVADVTGSSTSGNSLVVAEGTNKVTVTASSPTFSATVPAQDKIYACSSLKKTDEDHVVAASTATTITGAVKTQTGSTSITGAYKMYIGQSASQITTSTGIKSLSTNVWTNGANDVNIINTTTSFEANKYLVIAVPSAWTLKNAVNSFGLDGMIFGAPSTVKYVLPNDVEIDYNVYEAFLGEPYGFNSITIGK